MRSALAVALVSCLALPAYAEEPSAYEMCLQKAELLTDSQVAECELAGLKELDAQLNARYAELMRSSRDGDFKKALQASQRAWVGYKEATCAFEGGSYRKTQGPLNRVDGASCLRSMTEERVNWLNKQNPL